MKPMFLLLLLIGLLFCGGVWDTAAQPTAPGTPVEFRLVEGEGKYITEWLLLGPFDGTDLAKDYLAAAGGEAKVQPKEGDTVTTEDGEKLMWKRYTSPTNTVDLLAGIGSHENVTAYAACTIISAKAQTMEAHLGSDDGVKVWLNGKPVHTHNVKRSLTLDEDLFPMTLDAGTNRLLIKVYNGTSDWSFTLRLLDEVAYRRAISDQLEIKSSKLTDFETGALKLSIKAIRIPESSVFKLPPAPVTIEVYDSNGQVLIKGEHSEEEALVWPVPDYFEGDVRIVASQTDVSGKVRRGELSTSTRRFAKDVRQVMATTGITTTGTEGVWKTYRYVDGLAGILVGAILQDKEGAIWFGTRAGGVSRFDGRSWKTYTEKDGLANNDVRAVIQDKEGAIWFGTGGGGVSRFDGVSWKTYTQRDGLANNDVNAIIQDREGAIWFGAWGAGVSRFDGKLWKTYTQKDGLADNNVRAIMQDKEEAIWFGTEGGVSRFDGKSWKTYTRKDGLAGNHVSAILQDKEGAIWFGTRGGVSRFDGIGWETYTERDGLANNYVWSIIQDKEGAIWFGTWGGGVSQFDGKSWKTYTQKDGLASNSVFAIMQDKEGAMWFGTMGGVSRFDGVSWKTYTKKDGLASNCVYAIIQDKEEAIWFGTDGGVSRFDGVSWKTYTKKDGLADNDVIAIIQDKEGAIWVGTEGGGVSRFDGIGWETYTERDGLASNYVWSIIQDKEEAIWFGTGGGVSRFDGKSWKTYTKKDGLADNDVIAIIQDKEGAIWFGTNGGVSRFDGKSWRTYTQNDGLANNYLRAVLQDKEGTIWFGTWGGVSRFDRKNWKTYTQENGLANNGVFAIMQDKEGAMWFGTRGGGVSRFDGRCFQTIDSRDGLAGDIVLCVYMDRGRQIWIGTDSVGVVRFIPNKIPPPVYITQIFADEQSYSRPGESLNLTTDVTRIAFDFHAISFKTRPGGMKYFYQLVGKEPDWQGPTNQETVEYFNLKSGEYTFKVQAVDRDLNYSEPASLHITIPSPPFYTRTGFLISVIQAVFTTPICIYIGFLIRRKKKAFEPIPNPYIVGNPIRSKDMFFGREDDFRFIQAKLGTGETGLVIVFAGERRSGKTSILFQILNGRLGDQFVPVILDMQGMTVDSEAEFFEKIATEINSALGDSFLTKQLLRIELPPNAFREGNPTRTFESFISDVMNALNEKALTLLFDEYELIETKIDDGILRSDIITFFASLLEAHPKLSFIFTGSRHLEQRNPKYWHVLIGKSLYRMINFLSERDTLRLVREPVKGSVEYPRGIPERIYRITAGQPFYTQVVCQNLVDRMNEVQRGKVYQEDLKYVVNELADNPLPQMLYFWDGLKYEQKVALSFLGEVLDDSDKYTSAGELAKFAQEQGIDFSMDVSEMEGILGDLFGMDVLERERAGEGRYEYRFRVDLLRVWIRQAHSVWQR